VQRHVGQEEKGLQAGEDQEEVSGGSSRVFNAPLHPMV
jgi:hypothetical protein